ncbi:MAG TPA: PDZ domain-containing protein [Acidimicrobiales bacterium]
MICALLVVLLAIIALHSWNLNEYALTPGDATPVAPLVKVEGVATAKHQGKIMLTDVYLTSLNAWQWLTLHFSSHVQFVGANELVEPGVPTDELGAQGYLQMSDSKQAAEVSAFKALGWKTPVTHTGAIVNSVNAPSPARTAGIHVADEIVAVNGTAVASSCALVRAVHDFAPGTKERLTIDRAKISPSGTITYRAPSSATLIAGVTPSGSVASSCAGVSGVSKSWLGVGLEDGNTYALPARVTINTQNIGGPSAGLAMTLTLIDKLSKTSISGNQPIAATGTMDVYGNVGDVGGVAEKTVAVQRAGAKYFFVPQVEVATAKSTASPGLTIVGVTTLQQALRDLRKIGGASPEPITKPH